MVRLTIITKNSNLKFQLRRMQKNFMRKLEKCLEELKNTEYSNLTVVQPSSVKVENVKNLLCQVGGKRVNFTESQKRNILQLLFDVMKPMQMNVEYLSFVAATKEKLLPPLPTKEELLPPLPTKEERLPPLPTKEELLPPLPTKEKLLPPLPTKEELVECLQDLIEYVEYTDITVVRGKSSLDLIPKVGRKQKNFTEKFVKCIEELKHTDYSKRGVAYASNATVDNFLCLLFEVGRKRINFAEGEKRQIGNLLVDVIKPIQRNVASISMLSRGSQYNSVRMIRSALQFLVENYGQFPARNSNLKNELEKADIKTSIAYLDHIIEMWRDDSDTDMDSTDDEEAEPLDLPDTHTWWFK